MKYCFLNGNTIPLSKARISPADIGLLRGYAIFEVIRFSEGRIFNFGSHMNRMFRSAEKMRIKIPYTREEIKEIIGKLIEKNEGGSYVRIVLTGGEAIEGMSYDPEKPTFLIMIENLKEINDSYYKNGAKLLTVEHERPLPDIKTTNYTTALGEIPKAKKEGAIDILYTSKGKVLESSTSNFFIVKKGTVITPKEGILPGTTRKIILEIAKEGFSVEEREVYASEIKDADEAFITAVNKKILPITKVDDVVIGGGKVGETTLLLTNLFREKEGQNFKSF